jgi:phage FluMu protein Com
MHLEGLPELFKERRKRGLVFERSMSEIRCKKCRRLLMKGEVKAVEIKCPKCGHIQVIEGYGEGGGVVVSKFGALRVPVFIEDPESLTNIHKQRRLKQ